MRWLYLFLFLGAISLSTNLNSQTNSFSKGKWGKIATTKQGIYQLTGNQIKQMGFPLPIKSATLQIWGFDYALLTEKVKRSILGNTELAIQVLDGGDGQLDESDKCIFYSAGPILWEYDSTANSWTHVKNTTQDTSYYFITIGAQGKRILTDASTNATSVPVQQYQSHILIETDSINILNSGKQWLGAPMGLGQGKITTLSYPIDLTGLVPNAPIHFNGRYLASSFNTEGIFEIQFNDSKIRTVQVAPVSGLVYDATAKSVIDSFNFSSAVQPPNNIVKLGYSGSANSTGWLDYIELHPWLNLSFNSNRSFAFNFVNAGSSNQTVQYQIQNADSSTLIWDVSNIFEPIAYKGTYQNKAYTFSALEKKRQSFYALKQDAFESVFLLDTVANQDLQSMGQVDYLILAPSAFSSASKKLQQFHQDYHGLKVAVVDPVQIYNEFSGAQVSHIAIRNFIQYLKEKSIMNGYPAPSYLLLFGGANFNIKKLDKHIQLPVYESESSNDVLSTYSSDDFYGIVEEGLDINDPRTVGSLAIAIGRIPAKTKSEADTLVEKLIQYQLHPQRGAWQNQLAFIADDEDYNLHLQDAEEITQHLKEHSSHWDIKKIYLDLFPAVTNSGGILYPEANAAITQAVNKGSLLLNYTGHGNYLRLSEQAVIASATIKTWDNAGRLPLLVTASCDFAPYDQPQLNPIGFDALFQNNKGIIGLVSANRLVFAYSNKQINDHFIQSLLVPDSMGNYLTIGKALQRAKQVNWSNNGDKLNAFKFNLIGDPALGLLQAKQELVFSALNKKVFLGKDTIQSGVLTEVVGKVQKEKRLNTSFNGIVEFIVWDVPREKSTLANLSTSIKTNIQTQESILFRGKGTVKEGIFTLNFILPTALSALQIPLKIEAFAFNDSLDALGVCDSIFVRSNYSLSNADTKGPIINAYINDTNFLSHSWVTNTAKLLVHLKDSSGIQSAGTTLGHDIECIIDNEIQNPIVLNNYFISDIDQYQSGWLSYTLPNLSEGQHMLTIKAWDIMGNLSKDTIYFEVPKTNGLLVNHLSNSPNPMTQKTRFSFDINQTNTSFTTTLELLSTQGTRLFQKRMEHYSVSNKIVMDWDGLDSAESKVPPGVYYYRIVIDNGTEKQVLTNKLIKL